MKLNKKLVLVVTLAALLIQLFIISYNQYTGLINITGLFNFVIRLLIGTAFSALFGLLLVFIDLITINKLDRSLPLPKKLYSRIPTEFFISLLFSIVIAVVITTLSHFIQSYAEGLLKNIVRNSLIVFVINLIIITILEAVIWFRRNQENKLAAEKLERENTEIRFETLKNQLNPHFLFNSLNALSSLIGKNPGKAQKFVDEFSLVYRYTLDAIDKQVVELKEEMEFVKAFLYLQKIRFDEAVNYNINIDAGKLEYFVPPLSIQTLLENCFKHNRASNDSPLRIEIYNQADCIIVENNLQQKFQVRDSKKVGLQNLKKRYSLICGIEPEFIITNEKYIAKIPLIKPE